jgi:23S rRNA (cytosine1962-C5)-methyltransferase
LAVRVTPDALRRVRAGHPWLFDHSITSLSHPGAPGDLAVVFDDDRKFAAIGLFDPASPIRVKVLHHGRPATIDTAFWTARLQRALDVRRPLTDRGDTTGMRLVNGESDGMPGMVVDRYDRVLVMKLYTTAWIPHLAVVVPALEHVFRPDSVVLRLARSLDAASLHGLEEGDALVGLPPDGPVVFTEHGLWFEADVTRGQKTGHFLDQRDNRALVRRAASGADVLDVFASTGGFTVHAAAGGAASVTAVDLSAPTLAVAGRNLALNHGIESVAACRFEPVVGDAFREMETLARRGRRFDVVVVDPPSFAQRNHEAQRALAAYGKLTGLALRLLRPGGLLVQCSCSSRVTADDFHTAVARAASSAGRPLSNPKRTGHALDHPVAFPEGAYLKAVLARVP